MMAQLAKWHLFRLMEIMHAGFDFQNVYPIGCTEILTLKQLELHRYMLGPENTDALVLEHQVIRIHSDDEIYIL